MEMRDIEYFGVIAQHGNMRRAAEALGLTPPALSKSLRRLEAAMEAKLVERTGKGVQLTPMGSALATQAQRMRLTLEDITREASDLNSGRAGHLRIGSGPTDCELLPAACTQLMKEAPRLTFDITITDNDELVPLLRDGKLDLGFNYIPPSPYEGIEQLRIYDDEYVVYASAAHALSRKRRVTMPDLVDEAWATSTASHRPKQLLDQLFAERGLPAPRFKLQTRSVRLRLQIISASMLLGFGPRHGVEIAASAFRLKVLPVKELTLPRSVGVMYRKGAYLAPSAKRLIELLKAAA
jgi:DNA-binding transcriptional LysR family regulator